MSRNAISSFLSFFIVKFMFWWRLLVRWKNVFRVCTFQKRISKAKRSIIKLICSWRDKLIIPWTLDRKLKKNYVCLSAFNLFLLLSLLIEINFILYIGSYFSLFCCCCCSFHLFLLIFVLAWRSEIGYVGRMKWRYIFLNGNFFI